MKSKKDRSWYFRQIRDNGVHGYMKKIEREKAEKLSRRREEKLARVEQIKREHSASLNVGLDGGSPNLKLRESVKDIAKYGLKLRLIGHS